MSTFYLPSYKVNYFQELQVTPNIRSENVFLRYFPFLNLEAEEKGNVLKWTKQNSLVSKI